MSQKNYGKKLGAGDGKELTVCGSCKCSVWGLTLMCMDCPNFSICCRCVYAERHSHHSLIKFPSIKFPSESTARATTKPVKEFNRPNKFQMPKNSKPKVHNDDKHKFYNPKTNHQVQQKPGSRNIAQIEAASEVSDLRDMVEVLMKKVDLLSGGKPENHESADQKLTIPVKKEQSSTGECPLDFWKQASSVNHERPADMGLDEDSLPDWVLDYCKTECNDAMNCYLEQTMTASKENKCKEEHDDIRATYSKHGKHASQFNLIVDMKISDDYSRIIRLLQKADGDLEVVLHQLRS